ncbi:tyrosyl-DNA phosphodiesterase-domain-containing protein [Gymnopilus junonius]|uniref:Tyrosyl-DNA phosphodiesterase-domain-containing protein n=1 Tax=Gymnopilus junonius TaxID=109634 RepID=A0A9P5NQF9_GYMJU|nr:tyrosyl-DNA phosphodiesterase-domain-containing protein [Gymnopilus junonius]
MSFSDEDDDLARAIALSLREQQARKPDSDVINLVSDDEEDFKDVRSGKEIKQALQASKSSSSHSHIPSQPSAGPSTSAEIGQSSDRPVAVSAFLAERAQLEKERRERQKRLRPSTPDPGSTTEEDDSEIEEPPAKRHQVSSSNQSRMRSNISGVSSSKFSSSNSIPAIEQVFWSGELRQTATLHAEPRKDGSSTFRLTEVLGKKSELSFAILSSYSLDWAWIYEFFDRSVPVIMVAQPDASGGASIKNVLPNWIRATPFLRNGFGCQHMKLFYKSGRLRVVVSTANLVAYDWRDMENSVWLQDIPLRSRPIPHDPKADDFPAVLQRMIYDINVRPALAAMIGDNHPDLPLKDIDELRQKWDWSNVKAHLVASIAGKHEGWPHVIHRNGHPRLMSVVRKMGMRTGNAKAAKDLVLECQGSSIGLYSTQWLNEFHWSSRGESAEVWLDKPKKSREKLPYPPVKLIFPTKATVQQSAAGEMGGGTIFCRRRQWSSKNFPKDIFYDSRSKGGPVLMHSKMIIATLQENAFSARTNKGESSDTEDDEIQAVDPGVGWVYVGSHNFTPSAWGTLSGSSFNPILNITNYEVGVVFLLKDVKEADRIACFQRPPRKYTTKDEPWMQEESAYHQAREEGSSR